MHFAALVALVAIASSVPGLAAPAPNPHPQAISKRDDSSTVLANGVHITSYESWAPTRGRIAANLDDRANFPYISGPVLDSVTTQRDGDSSKRSQTLPAGDVQGTGSNNNQGIASDTRRRSENNTISTWKVAGAPQYFWKK